MVSTLLPCVFSDASIEASDACASRPWHVINGPGPTSLSTVYPRTTTARCSRPPCASSARRRRPFHTDRHTGVRRTGEFQPVRWHRWVIAVVGTRTRARSLCAADRSIAVLPGQPFHRAGRRISFLFAPILLQKTLRNSIQKPMFSHELELRVNFCSIGARDPIYIHFARCAILPLSWRSPSAKRG
jgi:hypothetical protein